MLCFPKYAFALVQQACISLPNMRSVSKTDCYVWTPVKEFTSVCPVITFVANTTYSAPAKIKEMQENINVLLKKRNEIIVNINSQ